MHSRWVVTERLSLMVTLKGRVPAYLASRFTTLTGVVSVVSFSAVEALVPPLPTRTALIWLAPPMKILRRISTLLLSALSSP